MKLLVELEGERAPDQSFAGQMFPGGDSGVTRWAGGGDSQLHDEVQVVGALVDVLQSHDVLVLYPAGQKERKKASQSFRWQFVSFISGFSFSFSGPRRRLVLLLQRSLSHSLTLQP